MTIRLYFDTETTGLWDWKKSVDHDSQPHLAQIAAILQDGAGQDLAILSTYIQPNGWEIGASATAATGLTTEQCIEFGLPLKQALRVFWWLHAKADEIVVHNLDFDTKIMARAFQWIEAESPAPIRGVCTMKLATPVLKLPPKYPGQKTYKWPRLTECYQHFFGEELVGAHDALVDTRACIRVHRKLLELGVAS